MFKGENMKSIKKRLEKSLKRLSKKIHKNSERLSKLSNEEWSSAEGQKLVRKTNYLAQSEIFLRDAIASITLAEKQDF